MLFPFNVVKEEQGGQTNKQISKHADKEESQHERLVNMSQ
jgi:hypothetical protein